MDKLSKYIKFNFNLIQVRKGILDIKLYSK